MLINGRWTESDKVIKNGIFQREMSRFDGGVNLEFSLPPNGMQRYWLISSKSCQWSYSVTMSVCAQGLEPYIGIHVAHGERKQGYATNGGEVWQVPGTDLHAEHLHEVYSLADPGYTGRSTVPVLWDAVDAKILSNDSLTILRAFSELGASAQLVPLDLAPLALRDDIDTLNAWLFQALSNAVYRAGFAQEQEAYEEAVEQVFDALDTLEDRLTTRRFLFGKTMTESDLRLFATLVRFDAVYFILHRCCRRRLVDYPALWAYARDVYAWPGISETVDFIELMRGSYLNDTAHNPHHILPIVPFADWEARHYRAGMA